MMCYMFFTKLVKMLISTFLSHQMPNRPKLLLPGNHAQVVFPPRISPEFYIDLGWGWGEAGSTRIVHGYYLRQLMKTWSVKSRLADCCKSITPVRGSLNSSSRWWWLNTSTWDLSFIFSLWNIKAPLWSHLILVSLWPTKDVGWQEGGWKNDWEGDNHHYHHNGTVDQDQDRNQN